jgi:glutamate-ammonia-ligase adenylyltransferase
VNLRALAGRGTQQNTFAKLAVLAGDILKRKPDPDMALNNWERFVRSLGSPEFHYNVLLSQPMRMDILLSLFAGSQFLADTLVRNPGFLEWVTIPEILHSIQTRDAVQTELRKAAQGSKSHGEWLNKLRRFRRQGILRIGTRDMCLGVPTRDIMFELSSLAEGCTQVSLEVILDDLKQQGKIPEDIDEPHDTFCVMALGKLGGSELNYSSDIDLMALWDDRSVLTTPAGTAYQSRKDFFSGVMERLREHLSKHTEEGYAYRVDLRLRPFGTQGDLVSGLSGLIDYYRGSASLWEIQAALKMRPVAGNLRLGYDLIQQIQPLLMHPRPRNEIVASIEQMRRQSMRMFSRGLPSRVDVKIGYGGLREAEFLVQGLQLIHAPDNPALLQGNTLQAIDALQEANLLPHSIAEQLKQDYLFLRRTEHCLQVMEDLQTHTLPSHPEDLTAMGKRILGIDAELEAFMSNLTDCLNRIHDAYGSYLANVPTSKS